MLPLEKLKVGWNWHPTELILSEKCQEFWSQLILLNDSLRMFVDVFFFLNVNKSNRGQENPYLTGSTHYLHTKLSQQLRKVPGNCSQVLQ